MKQLTVSIICLTACVWSAGCDGSASAPSPEELAKVEAAAKQGEVAAENAFSSLNAKVNKNEDEHVNVLDLEKTDATDETLKDLNQFPELKRLYLSPKITDAGLAHIKGLTQLELLYLKGSQVTDQGLALLAGLASLEKLDLSGTKVTSAGLVHLKGLTSLKLLRLARTGVRDEGLENLYNLKDLTLLDLGGTKIRKESLEALRKALPDTRVDHN